MSIYRNQAKRVIDHICTSNQMTEDKVKELFGFSVEMIDNRIEMIVLKTGKNGKQCADMLIQSWEASHPDYINREYKEVINIDGLIFRMRVLPTEVIVFFNGAKGDYLHSYRTTEPFTDKVKEAAALDCLKAYNEKTA